MCGEDGRATGVVTTGRRGVPGKAVLSNADPKRTYLKLVDAKHLPADTCATSTLSRSIRR